MEVFVDTPDSVADGKEDDAPSAWPELGTRKSRVKENTREATKAVGTTLKQAGRSRRVASSSVTPKISVFRDPVPEEGDEENQPATDAREMLPPPAVPTKVPGSASSNAISVFRDEMPEQIPAKPSGSGKGINVFRDEESKTPAVFKGTKAGKEIAVFRDEEQSSSSQTTPVFRDDVTTQSEPRSCKSGKETDVFRDDMPESIRGLKSSKGSLVFKDEEPKPGRPPTKTKSSAGLAVFRDEDSGLGTEKAPATLKRSSKSAIPVFHDAEEGSHPVAAKRAKPEKGKGVSVFQDEEPEPSQKQKKTKLAKNIAVLRDEQLESGPSSLGKTTSKKSAIPVFCDDNAEPMVEAKKSKTAMGKVKAKEPMSVFRDEEASSSTVHQVDSPPTRFKPFKDEDEVSVSTLIFGFLRLTIIHDSCTRI
jgi:hypothetical protein